MVDYIERIALCWLIRVCGITTFLLNAFQLNCTGNSADMTFEHRCRNKSILFLLIDIDGQYMQTRSTLETSSNNLFINLERLGTRDLLFYGQLSYDTILISIQSNNTLLMPVNSLFDRLFSRHGLDLTSSLQILIELYVRWLTTNTNNLCLQLKYELIRSFIYLSDLFTSSQQLSNLYDLCDDYFRTRLLQAPNENINSLNNEHVNEEQEMIDSSSIISS
ncbi:unnamed protein product [Rotaria sp. Silwood1]|nr:unnamed protein product [Rotaria sp. Silwood1]CAF1650611.1 unnamed protein product [Rotaria sp. Silwood1]CAF3809175.1 unnamed protein product [Rotaria sp. Silwood1]CAF3823490.1 unnamed protein product [Rotaria sp. Silwood1]CAF3842814.1 unnamed protein product [Rotaria sp. Silwood1]